MARARTSDREPVCERPPAPAPSAVAVPDKPKGASLIEFSTEARDDPNDGIEFGDSPVLCVCPHCERSVITFTEHEASFVTWFLAFIVWFSLGWMALWVLPLLFPAFKDVVHHCPRCLNVVGRVSRIRLPTFRSEVMTVKVGSCAVVLARKYVLIAAGLVAVILTVCALRYTVPLTARTLGSTTPKGPPSMLTWEDFLAACGPRNALRHRTSTARSFEEKFRKRTFKWQGEVVMIREGFEVFMLRTKNAMAIRMYPQRFPRRALPDVEILFGEDLNQEVAVLNPGDWVEFEATMLQHGHRGDPEIMMLWHVAVAPKPSPLSSSATAADPPLTQSTLSDKISLTADEAAAHTSALADSSQESGQGNAPSNNKTV